MPIRGFARQFARNSPGYQSARPLIELGGLNEDENPQALRPTDLRLAYNCARKGSMTGTRPGVRYGDSDYPDALSGGDAIQGIHEYIRDYDATRDLVVVSGGDVFIDTTLGNLDKTTNTVTITDGADFHWNFAMFQDKLFAAGGDDGDSFWFWDGTGASPGVIDKVALGFDVKYVFSKWNMIFVAGLDGSTQTDNPMVWRYCDYASDATVAANYKASNVIPGQLLGENFGVGSYGSEYSTGMAEYTDNRGDFLLALTNKRIVSFRPRPPSQIESNANIFEISDTVPMGCVNQDAFVSLGEDFGDAVFMSRDGIHSLAMSQDAGYRVTEYLSWPIRRTFDSLNRARFKYVSGAFWPTEGMVLFSVATGSNTTNDLILCMDIKGVERLTPDTVRWYKWELNGITANRIVPLRGSDGKPYPYVGGTAGEVVRFERDVYADLVTNEINCQFRTRDEDYGIPSREKHAGDAFISVQGLGDYEVNHTLFFDDGENEGQTSMLPVPSGGSVWGTGVWGTMTWGDAQSTRRHRVPGVGSGVTVSHRFAHAGASEPFWIGQIDQQVMVSGPTDDADANVVGS
jgi:hypothetical protein